MFELILEALVTIASNFHLVLFAIFMGMFFGLLPGMGGTVGLALLIPLTLHLPPHEAFMLYGALLGATSFSGSLTAILLNTPGTAGNTATILDGYPMTTKGRAKEAIGAAASASAVGALIGLGLFILFIPLLRQFALLFGSPEVFWLALAGIAVIPAVVRGSMIKGLIAGGLGLLIAFHGYDYMTGEFRYSYLFSFHEHGDISFIPIIIGLFAVAEMLRLAIKNERITKASSTNLGGDLGKGIKSIFHYPVTFLQGSIVGFVSGVVPGVGGSVANMVSYGFAANINEKYDGENNPEEFGEGAIQGVIASESANDSKDGGQLVPTFGLGIPGSATMAVLLSAFLIHGFVPGPSFIVDQLPLILLVTMSLVVSNILTSVIGVATAKWAVYVTRVDVTYLFPVIIAICLIAAYTTRNSIGDVILAGVFGIIGFVFIYLEISRIPMIIAVVLGRIIEENFHRTIRLADDFSHFVQSPLSISLVLLLVLIFALPLYQKHRDKIKEFRRT